MSSRRSRHAIYALVTCLVCGVQLGCGAEKPPAPTLAAAEPLGAFCTRVGPELRTLGQLHATAVSRLGELAALERDALRQARALPPQASRRDRLIKAFELELDRVGLAARAARQAERTESMRAIAVAIRASDRAIHEAGRLLRELCA